MIAKGVVALTGEHVIAGVLVQRLVELLGVAMIVWAVPRLARRCGMDPVAALWLSVLNPLLLFHLIAGGHNEALMIGAMLAGLVLALDRHLMPGRGADRGGGLDQGDRRDGPAVPGDHPGPTPRRPLVGPVPRGCDRRGDRRR